VTLQPLVLFLSAMGVLDIGFSFVNCTDLLLCVSEYFVLSLDLEFGRSEANIAYHSGHRVSDPARVPE